MKPLIIASVTAAAASLLTAALIPTLLDAPDTQTLGAGVHADAAVTRTVSIMRSPGAAALKATLQCWHWRDNDIAARGGGNCLSGVQNPLLRTMLA